VIDREIEVRRLRAARPRSRLARGSGLLLFGLFAYAWLGGDIGGGTLTPERRRANLERFLGEIRPDPVREGPFDRGAAARWAGDFLRARGYDAALTTLAISVAAILIAGVAGLLLGLLAARTFASPEPYLPGPRAPSRTALWTWRAIAAATRVLFIFVRAIPEYVWAFLLLMAFGPSPWTAVFALAIHNVGILGRLDAETIENLPPAMPAALRGLGARRLPIAAFGLFPTLLPRFLLYYFYRWETCVREATVLGMVGVLSLGYWIADARARNQYDEMFALVLLGAALVLAGDVLSALARGAVRRAR